MDWLKKYLLSSACAFAPPDEGGGNPDDGDERIELQDDDDESAADPVDEDDHTEGDDQDDDGASANADGATGGQEPPARSSRGDRQYGELRRLARERAEENAQLTRRLADLEARAAQQPAQVTETAHQRAERMALMSPEERAMEMVNEALARNNQQQERITSQLMDQSDRSAYEARAAVNPLFKKFANDVERELASLRAKGQILPRETIATYLIGQRVVAQQSKQSGKPARRQRETTRPARPGGDVPAQRAGRRGGAPASAEDFEAQFGDVAI